jgi:hypothetical protein
VSDHVCPQCRGNGCHATWCHAGALDRAYSLIQRYRLGATVSDDEARDAQNGLLSFASRLRPVQAAEMKEYANDAEWCRDMAVQVLGGRVGDRWFFDSLERRILADRVIRIADALDQYYETDHAALGLRARWLARMLEKYGRHLVWCGMTRNEPLDCNCGLVRVLSMTKHETLPRV